MKITFIATGGTIDKDYSSKAGTYNFEIAEPAVKRILENVHLNADYEIISVLRKDSMDITDDDRQLIHNICLNSENDKIIITHGTDTMLDTARKLDVIKRKTIVIAGSFKPAKFSDSDASFNLGTAIGAVNILENGVYIAMNGRIYRWDKCKKEADSGKFTEK